MDITVREYDFKHTMKKDIPRVDYLTHAIHPYTAKLIPHIPRYFIGQYTKPGDTILDPFCGSGTTLLEATIKGRNAIGIDIHPLAKLISEVKTSPINAEKLEHTINSVKKQLKSDLSTPSIQFPNIDYWFSSDARGELERIKFTIERLNETIDCDTRKFLQLCFSSIIRKSSYADPRIAKTYKSKRVIEKTRNGWIPKPIQYFEEAMDRNSERMKTLSQMLNSNGNRAEVFQGDAKQLSSILQQNDIKEINLIITSPPYINAQDYFRSYKLELCWLGITTPEEIKYLKKQTIGTENLYGIGPNSTLWNETELLNTVCGEIGQINKTKASIVHKYFENMKRVFEESQRVLERKGHFCLITGNNNICGVQVPTHKILSDIAEATGFKIVETGRDKIRDRSLPPNRNHKGGIIEEEWVTVFEKGCDE